MAQIPYYLINYLFRYGAPPSVSAGVLLGLTLAWFLFGFTATRAGKLYGFWVLWSFTIVEGLFYLHTILSGAVGFQLSNPNSAIKVVFIIGYVCGLVSLAYAVPLLVFRTHYLSRPRGT
ncbi:MAG TPA: hypothetical protein VGN48_05920 [Pedococcus sp.]|nr:hypothetical protein [Pedococcus sp.]